MNNPKNVIVTGGSHGIGLEWVGTLLKNKASVIATSRSPEFSKELQQLKRDFSSTLNLVVWDAENEATDKNVVDAAANLPSLDLLLNNAGVYLGTGATFGTLALADIRKSFEVNTIAPLRLTRALLPNLKATPNAIVMHTSSLMGSVTDNESGGSYAYRMSKAALNMFNRSFAIDHPELISVVVHPGWVRTRMGGENAPTTVEQSVRGLFKLYQGLTAKDSGKLIDFEGEVLPF